MNNGNPHTQPLQEAGSIGEIVIERSLTNTLLVLFICLLFFFLTGLVDTRGLSAVPLAFFLIFRGLWGVGAILFTVGLVTGLPRIVLDATGIRYLYVFRKKSWNWNECGRFYLSTQPIPGGPRPVSHRYACAFNSFHQRAIDAEDAGLMPDYLHADILIPLDGTVAGKSEKAAQELIDQLNDLRERHADGSDEEPICLRNNLAVLEALQAKGQKNRRLYALIMMALMIATTALLVIY